MKSKSIFFSVLICTSLLCSGCSMRLVDFTAISSKNVNLGLDRSQGVQVEGSEAYIFGFGWNIKDAMDEALEEAGSEYDLLMDGVVRYANYFFVSTVTVEGTAYNSRAMQTAMGNAAYEEWLSSNDIYQKADATSGIGN